MPCWSRYLSPRLLASGRTMLFPTLFKVPRLQGFYHCGLSYPRLSTSNVVTSSALRARILMPRVRTVARVGLRPGVALKAQRTGHHRAGSPADTNTTSIPPPGSRDTEGISLEDRCTESEMVGGSSGEKLPSKANRALVLEIVGTLMIGLLCLYTPKYLDFNHCAQGWLISIYQIPGTYQQEEAGTEYTYKQRRNDLGGVGSKILSLFKILTGTNPN